MDLSQNLNQLNGIDNNINNNNNKRGIFILFEGIDRCGKTTQSKLLANYLLNIEKLEIYQMNFPDRTTEIGMMINEYLKNQKNMNNHAIHLLFTANRWENYSMIKKILLNDKKHIIMDRYSYSGVAFSGAKESLDINWCFQSEKGLPEPDIIFYLDISLEKASLREAYGEERYEKIEFQKKVQNNFISMINKEKNNKLWYIIDATKSIEEIHNEIILHVKQCIKKASFEKLKYL